MQKIKIVRGVCLSPKEVMSISKILLKLGNKYFDDREARIALKYGKKLRDTYNSS